MCHILDTRQSSGCAVFFFCKESFEIENKKRLPCAQIQDTRRTLISPCAPLFAVCPRSDTRQTIGHLAVFGLRPLTLSLSRPRVHPVDAPPPDAPGRTCLRPPRSAPGRKRPRPPSSAPGRPTRPVGGLRPAEPPSPPP